MDRNPEIILLDLDQQVTCPLCGTRTDFHDLVLKSGPAQFHECLNNKCNFQFIGEFDGHTADKNAVVL